MTRLQGALDNEIHIAVQRFLGDGVLADPNSLYAAIQKSNSSLKRRPKKVLQASIERVLDFLGEGEEVDDSGAEIENKLTNGVADADSMNKSLRSNLVSSRPSTPPAQVDEQQRKRRMANGEPISKRQKAGRALSSPPASLSLDDVGGMDDAISQFGELVLPLLRPQRFKQMNLKLSRGVLLHGPPGCGKTMLIKAFAAELDLPFVEILGPSVVSSMSGDSEKAIREKFEEAKKNAPCLLFIDELDALAPKRESSQSQMERRIVGQLLVSMDELGEDYDNPVVVMAATNRPDSVDPALRRGGRFDTEINIKVPSEQVREHILRAQTRNTALAKDVDLRQLAKLTPGYVGADLAHLVTKAGMHAMGLYEEALMKQERELTSAEAMDVDGTKHGRKSAECVEDLRTILSRCKRTKLPEPPGFEEPSISMASFMAVLPKITPSAKREGFATIPNVSWDDVGALASVRQELQLAIVEPIKDPESYAQMGISAPTGVLLWGPPGCGKTLLAKAVAAESNANFISVKGPELLDKYVGESEAAIRRVFTRARSSVPCVIFFDEFDALVKRRNEEGTEVSARVVNTFLTELDGLDAREGIYVIAATNRPDMIDEAMLRPGRLETPLFVDLPGANERAEIMSTLAREKPIEDIDNAAQVARSCDGYSGADLGALLREAAQSAIRRKSRVMQAQDLDAASKKVHASVANMEHYQGLRERFGAR